MVNEIGKGFWECANWWLWTNDLCLLITVLQLAQAHSPSKLVTDWTVIKSIVCNLHQFMLKVEQFYIWYKLDKHEKDNHWTTLLSLLCQSGSILTHSYMDVLIACMLDQPVLCNQHAAWLHYICTYMYMHYFKCMYIYIYIYIYMLYAL